MKELYLKIIDNLTNAPANAKFTSKQLPTIKFVDIFKGQYFDKQRFELYKLPAVFFQWSIDHGTGEAIITIHIEYEQQRDTSSKGQQLTGALQFFGIIETINELLVDTETEATSKLKLTAENSVREDTLESIYTLTYSCEYTGKEKPAAAQWNWTEDDAEPNISGVIVKSIDD